MSDCEFPILSACWAYEKGCRCERCKGAKAVRAKERRERGPRCKRCDTLLLTPARVCGFCAVEANILPHTEALV